MRSSLQGKKIAVVAACSLKDPLSYKPFFKAAKDATGLTPILLMSKQNFSKTVFEQLDIDVEVAFLRSNLSNILTSSPL